VRLHLKQNKNNRAGDIAQGVEFLFLTNFPLRCFHYMWGFIVTIPIRLI
jgi:hypothetical protein